MATPEKQICGAKNRRGLPCQLQAGWGTDHLGQGRCRKHGGNAGAPVGNQNALRTGEFEHIAFDTLTDDEKALVGTVPIDDPVRLCQAGIMLLEIRERRMMERIARLQGADDGMTAVEAVRESGFRGDDEFEVQKTRSKAVLGQIQDIEEALTRVQDTKRRAIELLVKVRAGRGDDEALERLADSIQAMVEKEQ